MVQVLQAVSFPRIIRLEESEQIEDERILDVLSKDFGFRVDNEAEEDVIDELEVRPGGSWRGDEVIVVR